MEREDRGAFNEIVELASAPISQIITPPGESGFIPYPVAATPHIRDQVPLYESFTYRPMPFTLGELEAPTTTQTLTLP